jgi:hypothetical protein
VVAYAAVMHGITAKVKPVAGHPDQLVIDGRIRGYALDARIEAREVTERIGGEWVIPPALAHLGTDHVTIVAVPAEVTVFYAPAFDGDPIEAPRLVVARRRPGQPTRFHGDEHAFPDIVGRACEVAERVGVPYREPTAPNVVALLAQQGGGA